MLDINCHGIAELPSYEEWANSIADNYATMIANITPFTVNDVEAESFEEE